MKVKKIINFCIFALIVTSIYFGAQRDYSSKRDVIHNDAIKKEEQMHLKIYSARKEEFLKDIFDKFEKLHNVKIDYINDDAYKLIERIKSDDNSGSRPDLLITADMGAMDYANSQGLLIPADCNIMKKLDSFFKDNDSCKWAAITFRARLIAYAKDKINPAEIVNYSDLAEEKYRGQIIATPMSSPYNQFFLAHYLETSNQNNVRKWLSSFTSNLASSPSGSDTEKIRSIAAGNGSLALVNSYYYLRFAFAKDSDRKAVFSKVGAIFPNQDSLGTHINFSSIGIVRGAQHKIIANKFIEFLLSDEVQKILVEKNYEYSVTLDNNEMLNKKLGFDNVKFDKQTSLIKVAKNVKDVLKIASEYGWN